MNKDFIEKTSAKDYQKLMLKSVDKIDDINFLKKKLKRYLKKTFYLQHKLEKNQKIIAEIKEYINGHTNYYDDGEYSCYECEIDGLILLEILERGLKRN